MISLYDLVDELASAADAAESGDDAGYDAHVNAFAEGVAGTAGAIGGYEVDYVLRDVAAALELGEPPAAAAGRIRGALDRLRDLSL